MNGHFCSKCDREWTHDGCTIPLTLRNTVDCKRCESLYVLLGFEYVNDEFTDWVMKIRKEAGVV